MKKNLFFLFFLLCFGHVYSQIQGIWEIVKCFPEITGLTTEELSDFQNECMGNIVFIDSIKVKFLGENLTGYFEDTLATFSIINQTQVSDSLKSLLRYFCQEIDYIGAITLQTITFLDSSYNRNNINVLFFICNEYEKIKCLSFFILNQTMIGMCIPGDAIYLLKRM